MNLVPSYGASNHLINLVIVHLTGFICASYLSGSVHARCPPGFIPPDCLKQCKPGTYGLKCASTCPGTCLNNTCHPKSGNCPECRTGFRGTKCDEKCPPGFYGQNCRIVCPPNCDRSRCDPFTGFCYSCLDGFAGRQCNITVHMKPRVRGTSRRGRSFSGNTENSSDAVLAKVAVLLAGVCIPAFAFCLGMWSLKKHMKVNVVRKRPSSAISKKWGGGKNRRKKSLKKVSRYRSSRKGAKLYLELNEHSRQKPKSKSKMFTRLTKRQSHRLLKDSTSSNKGKGISDTKENFPVKTASGADECSVQLDNENPDTAELSEILIQNSPLRISEAASYSNDLYPNTFFDDRRRPKSFEVQSQGSKTSASESNSKLKRNKLQDSLLKELSHRLSQRPSVNESTDTLEEENSTDEQNRGSKKTQKYQTKFKHLRTESSALECASVASDSRPNSKCEALFGFSNDVGRRCPEVGLNPKPTVDTSDYSGASSKQKANVLPFNSLLVPKKSSATITLPSNSSENVLCKCSHVNAESCLEPDQVLKAKQSWEMLQQSLIKVLEEKSVVRMDLPVGSKAFPKPDPSQSIKFPAFRQPGMKKSATRIDIGQHTEHNPHIQPTKETPEAYRGKEPQQRKSLMKVFIDAFRSLSRRCHHHPQYLQNENDDVEKHLSPLREHAELAGTNRISILRVSAPMNTGFSKGEKEKRTVTLTPSTSCIVHIENRAPLNCRTAKEDDNFRIETKGTNDMRQDMKSNDLKPPLLTEHSVIADITQEGEAKIPSPTGGTLKGNTLEQNLPLNLGDLQDETLSSPEHPCFEEKLKCSLPPPDFITRDPERFYRDCSMFLEGRPHDQSICISNEMNFSWETTCVTSCHNITPPSDLALPFSSNNLLGYFNPENTSEPVYPFAVGGTFNHDNWFPFSDRRPIPIFSSPLSMYKPSKQSVWNNYSFFTSPVAQQVSYHPVFFELPRPPQVLPENDVFLEISYAKLTEQRPKPVVVFSDAPGGTKNSLINTFEIVDKHKIRRVRSPSQEAKRKTNSPTSFTNHSTAQEDQDVAMTKQGNPIRKKPTAKTKSSDIKHGKTNPLKDGQPTKKTNREQFQQRQERFQIYLRVKPQRPLQLPTLIEAEDSLHEMEEVENDLSPSVEGAKTRMPTDQEAIFHRTHLASNAYKENSRKCRVRQLRKSKDKGDMIAHEAHASSRKSKSVSDLDLSKSSDNTVNPRVSNEKSDKKSVKPPAGRSTIKSLCLEANSWCPSGRKDTKEKHRGDLKTPKVKTEKSVKIPNEKIEDLKRFNLKTDNALKVSAEGTERVVKIPNTKTEGAGKLTVERPVPTPRKIFLYKNKGTGIQDNEKGDPQASSIRADKRVVLTPSPRNYSSYAAALEKLEVKTTDCIVHNRQDNSIQSSRKSLSKIIQETEEEKTLGAPSFSWSDAVNAERSPMRYFDSPSHFLALSNSRQHEQDGKCVVLQQEAGCVALQRGAKCVPLEQERKYDPLTQNRTFDSLHGAANEMARCKTFQYILRSPESAKISTKSPLIVSGKLGVTLKEMEGDLIKVNYPLPSLLENVIQQEVQQCIAPNNEDAVESIDRTNDRNTIQHNISPRPRPNARKKQDLVLKSAQACLNETSVLCSEEPHERKLSLAIALSPKPYLTPTTDSIENDNHEFKSLNDDSHDIYYDALDYSDTRSPVKHAFLKELNEKLLTCKGKGGGKEPHLGLRNLPRKERHRQDGCKSEKGNHSATMSSSSTKNSDSNISRLKESQRSKKQRKEKSEDKLETLVAFRFAPTIASERTIPFHVSKQSKRLKLKETCIEKVSFRDYSKSTSEEKSENMKVGPDLERCTRLNRSPLSKGCTRSKPPLARTTFSNPDKDQAIHVLSNASRQSLKTPTVQSDNFSSSISTMTSTPESNPVGKNSEKVQNPILQRYSSTDTKSKSSSSTQEDAFLSTLQKPKLQQCSSTDTEPKSSSSTQDDAFLSTYSLTQYSLDQNNHSPKAISGPMKNICTPDKQKFLTTGDRNTTGRDDDQATDEIFYDVTETTNKCSW